MLTSRPPTGTDDVHPSEEMDGVHDLGGMHGFGPVTREANEPPFHAPWEAAVVAMMRATLHGAGLYNIDEFRHGIERMEPAHYLASSYFEHWLDGIARILIEKGVIDLAELDARTAFFLERPGLPASAAARGAPVASVSSTRGPETSFRPPRVPPRFDVGAAVLTRNMHPSGHTRLPRYARGKRGVIDTRRGFHVFPDTSAHGLGDQPQHVYSVRFDSRELWGEAAEPDQRVYLDLWESYLQPA
jgi:nitrile hydratase subunit beta